MESFEFRIWKYAGKKVAYIMESLFNIKIKKNKNIVPRVYGDNTQVEAKAYGAIDFNTGEVLVHKNLEMSLPIASVTKIMTAVVALDLAEKDDLFTVSRKASKVSPTKIGVVPEQKMTLQELLNALLLTDRKSTRLNSSHSQISYAVF